MRARITSCHDVLATFSFRRSTRRRRMLMGIHLVVGFGLRFNSALLIDPRRRFSRSGILAVIPAEAGIPGRYITALVTGACANSPRDTGLRRYDGGA